MAKTLKDYLDTLEDWQLEVVEALLALVREQVPDAEEAIKWSQPVFSRGGPFCYIKHAKNHVNLGFWWGVKLDDPAGALEGTGDKMRHVKVRGLEEIDPAVLGDLIRKSAQANIDFGDPTRNKK